MNLQRPIWLSPPISHTAYHPFAPRIEKVRGGDRELHLSANNGCLPQSCVDSPECLIEKLIMASWGWIGVCPRTTHHYWGPWNCTWRPHSQVWRGVWWGAAMFNGTIAPLNTPNVSIFSKRKSLEDCQVLQWRIALDGYNSGNVCFVWGNSHWDSV